MKAALYLFGHGPYRKPRIIEMQYFRTLRYCRALEEKLKKEIDIKGTYIDINFPRAKGLGDLSNLHVLLNSIKNQEIDTVLVDICHGNNFYQNKCTPVIEAMERTGAKVYNCYYDDEDALLSILMKSYGENVRSYMLPHDREEFVELFPALASEITYEVLEDWLSKIPAGDNDPFINYVFRSIDSLRDANPYSQLSLPWLSHKKLSKLYQLKKEELDKRRLIEETYSLGPEQTGKLFDENIDRLRDQKSLKWALDRLTDLGFHHHVDEKVHSFIMEYAEHVLYADPRESGAIEIFVYNKKTGEGAIEKKRSKGKTKYPIGSFKMQDRWKRDLKIKLINRVERITQQK